MWCSFRMKTTRAFLSIAAYAVLCGCGSSEEPAATVAAAPRPAPAEERAAPAPAPAADAAAAGNVALLEQTPAYGEAARSN